MSLLRFFAGLLLGISVLSPVCGELATPFQISLDTRMRSDGHVAYSVDSATGAMAMNLNLLTHEGGRIPLEFNVSYNSFLADWTETDRLFGGWGHQYDAWLQEPSETVEPKFVETKFIDTDHLMTVRLHGNLRTQFRWVGHPNDLRTGRVWGPEKFVSNTIYNQHDRLELLGESAGDLVGLWRLRLLDGTTYLFHPDTGKVLSIQNRNGVPINFDYSAASGYAGELLSKITTVSRGFRTSGGDQSDLTISASLTLCYRSRNGADIDGGINAIVQEGDTPQSSLYTHVKIAEGTRRLEAIYDPVTLENMGHRAGEVTVPGGQTIEYTFNVVLTESDRLIRITPDIDLDKGRVTLVSPGGRTVKVHYNEPDDGKSGDDDEETTGKTGATGFFTDRFLGENPAGEWKLIVENQSASNKAGTIREILLERSQQPANGIRFTFAGTTNRILSMLDTLGQPISSQIYDGNDRVVLQTDGRGDSWRIEYEDVPGGLHTTVRDRTPAKHATVYQYDRDFLLRAIFDAMGNPTFYNYVPGHADLAMITNAAGQKTKFEYDRNGQLAMTLEPGDLKTEFKYDEFAIQNVDYPKPEKLEEIRGYKPITITTKKFEDIPTEKKGRIIIVFHDDEIQRLRIFDREGVRIIDRPGAELHHGKKPALIANLRSRYGQAAGVFGDHDLFDPADQETADLALDTLLESTDGGLRGNLTSIIDAKDRVTTFRYNNYNHVIRTENARQHGQTLTYDEHGSVTEFVNKDEHCVSATYDENGKPISVRNDDEETNPERLEYDAFGRITKQIDASGASVTLRYDTLGNVLETVNDLNHRELKAYDHRGRLVSKKNDDDHEYRSEYDGNGNVIAVINPKKERTEMVYDEEDRLISTKDPMGYITKTEYDALGRVVRNINGVGTITSFEYDVLGNRTATYRAGVLVKAVTYNELNLPETETDAFGNTTTYAYDEMGNRTAVTDAQGRTTTFVYDELDRLTETIDPRNLPMKRLYLPDDVVDKIVGPKGNETRFTYTAKNDVASVITADGVSRIEYTDNSQVSLFVPPEESRAQKYSYNEVNRLVKTEHINAPGTADVLYAYDARGNLLRVSTQVPGEVEAVKITRAFDELNRKVAATDAEGNTIRHFYDKNGQVSKIIYPDQSEVNYSYDRANRLKTVTDSEGRVTWYQWNARDQITSIRFPNGTSRVMNYSDRYRLLSRTDYDAKGGVIVQYQYEHDASNYVVEDARQPTPVPYKPTLSEFKYSPSNRLIEWNGMPVSYDADGNVTQGPLNGKSAAYAWDHRSNLRQAGGDVFRYDVQERLVGWNSGGESMAFAVMDGPAGAMVLASKATSAGGATSSTNYVYGVGLAYEVKDGELVVHHYDERGNTVAVSDSQGQVSARVAYCPFGEVIQETGDPDTIFKYGALYGVVTAPNGLNHMRFRWYSPEMKRFLSMDSVYGDIDLPSTLNRYIFAFNNPVNYVDPEGELAFLAVIAIGALAGAAIGVTVEAISAEIQGRPHRWQNYFAAAVGGALGGAVIAAAGPQASAVLYAGIGSALDSAFESATHMILTEAGIGVREIGFGEFLAGAAFAGVTGALGSKVGSKVSKKASGLWKKYFGKSSAEATNKLVRQGATESLTGLLVEEASKELLKKQALRFVKSVAGGSISSLIGREDSPVSVAKREIRGRAGKYMKELVSGPVREIGVKGEHQHVKRFHSSLDLARRPGLNPPIAIPSF